MNERCQVFTPPGIVRELLDSIGYDENIYDKKIIDNACGDGQILCEVVRRYIRDARRQGITDECLCESLQKNIFGIEIDERYNSDCKFNLNCVLEEYNLGSIEWNILHADALKVSFLINFQYVVGNPPYIKYSDLVTIEREYVRKYYETCKKGKFDYCYAFIEQGIKLLTPNGKMAYLIPNSIFKNVFAEDLRKLMLPYVERIIDFKSKKIFEKAMTSSTIVSLVHSNDLKEFTYIDNVKKISNKICKKELKNKWMFRETNFILREKKRFGDYFKASISIATQLNEAFIISDFTECEEYYKVETGRLERSIVRKAVSPRNMRYGKEEIIIFPYRYEAEKLFKYTENEFLKKFPDTVIYLNQYKDKLLKRDSDKKAKWFEYGRSQAITHLNQEKLLLSTVVTNEVNVYDMDKHSIPYSGIYITSSDVYDLKIAKKILQSESFLSYVKSIGINANGTSVRITPADINNFLFEMEGFDGKS